MRDWGAWVDQEAARLQAVESFDPQPLDYPRLIADGVPEVDYIEAPYLPAGASVLGVGPSESAKSMHALATLARLSRRGVSCRYISQENPENVDLRRLAMLMPDPEYLTMYHDQGFDLAIPSHVQTLIALTTGARLVVVDTWSACWSGDENDNAQVVGFDREVVRPVIRATGATVWVLDHTGHAQAFVTRKGVSAPRGASAKGQKADVLLEFKSTGPTSFSIEHSKNRFGPKAPPRQYRIVDTEDDRLELVAEENVGDARTNQIADAIVALVGEMARPVSKREIREALKGSAGQPMVDAALLVLQSEEPPRVEVGRRKALARDGKERPMAAVWLVGGLPYE